MIAADEAQLLRSEWCFGIDAYMATALGAKYPMDRRSRLTGGAWIVFLIGSGLVTAYELIGATLLLLQDASTGSRQPDRLSILLQLLFMCVSGLYVTSNKLLSAAKDHADLERILDVAATYSSKTKSAATAVDEVFTARNGQSIMLGLTTWLVVSVCWVAQVVSDRSPFLDIPMLNWLVAAVLFPAAMIPLYLSIGSRLCRGQLHIAIERQLGVWLHADNASIGNNRLTNRRRRTEAHRKTTLRAAKGSPKNPEVSLGSSKETFEQRELKVGDRETMEVYPAPELFGRKNGGKRNKATAPKNLKLLPEERSKLLVELHCLLMP